MEVAVEERCSCCGEVIEVMEVEARGCEGGSKDFVCCELVIVVMVLEMGGYGGGGEGCVCCGKVVVVMEVVEERVRGRGGEVVEVMVEEGGCMN
jgi:hypothetical protein